MTYEEIEAETKRLAVLIDQFTGSSMENATFAARELGFQEHTKVHALAREVLCQYAARIVIYDRHYGLTGKKR